MPGIAVIGQKLYLANCVGALLPRPCTNASSLLPIGQLAAEPAAQLERNSASSKNKTKLGTLQNRIQLIWSNYSFSFFFSSPFFAIYFGFCHMTLECMFWAVLLHYVKLAETN